MAFYTKLDLINDKFCQSTGENLHLSGNTYISSNGTIQYTTNQSSTYTLRSLVDKEYVTGLTSCLGIQTANNGLSKSGLNVKLGGALTGNTSITGNYTLTLSGGSKLNTTCGYQISGITLFRTSNQIISSIYLGENAGNNGSGVDNFGIGYAALSSNTTGYNNVGIGRCVLNKNTIGFNNVGIGQCSLGKNTCGCGNIAIGLNSMLSNTTGCYNTSFGNNALQSNTIGLNNIAIGLNALNANTCGCDNIALGQNSLQRNILGTYNITMGCDSMYYNTTGSGNVGIGRCNLFCNVCGYNNVSMGNYAMQLNCCGASNVAIGTSALFNNREGLNNIGIGGGSLYCNCIGCYNIAIGNQSLLCNSIGCYNVSLGCNAGYSNLTGSSNIYIGTCAGYNNTTSGKLFIATGATKNLIYGDFGLNQITIPTLLLCSTPETGTSSDVILAWNSSDKKVKQVTISSGDRNNVYSKTIVTGSTLLTTGSSYVILVNHTIPVTITLPPTPTDGQAFKIKDISVAGALTNNITISPNGNCIDRIVGDGLINTDSGALEFMYESSLSSWFSLGFMN